MEQWGSWSENGGVKVVQQLLFVAYLIQYITTSIIHAPFILIIN